ncbi:hypothetical protein HMPREF1582_00458 [Gardnerella vaginalis JCP8151A]|nr:hypothetical protein HMPREF1582_00458 [Gardnerella vaginalis JCP8151A]
MCDIYTKNTFFVYTSFIIARLQRMHLNKYWIIGQAESVAKSELR